MKYGAAVDCYALGCVVYQMLHGSTPYFHQDEDTQLDNIIEGGLAYPKNSFGQVRETGGGMVWGRGGVRVCCVGRAVMIR